jgi:RNA polymerase sigma-70 factor (ECF subfamily)
MVYVRAGVSGRLAVPSCPDVEMKGSVNPVRDSSPSASRIHRALLGERDRFRDFLERRVGSREVAEDLLQAAYAKALERAGQLRDEESAVAWFFRILRNSVVERSRREGAAARALERLASEIANTDPPEDAARTVCACIHNVLGTLKPEYEGALRAVDLDGGELRAFARDAGISPNNAAVRLHRSRQALRKRLVSMCGACARHNCIDCTCRRERAKESADP